MDFDENRIYYSHQSLQQNPTTTNNDGNNVDFQGGGGGSSNSNNNNYNDNNNNDDGSSLDPNSVRRHVREFLRNYHLGASKYIYRDQLLQLQHNNNAIDTDNNNHHQQQQQKIHNAMSNNGGKIEIDLAHLGEYNASLTGSLLTNPDKYLPYFEMACIDALKSLLYNDDGSGGGTSGTNNNDDIMMDDDSDDEDNNNNNEGSQQRSSSSSMISNNYNIQVILKSNQSIVPLRKIKSEHINKLIKCTGIIISTSSIRSRASVIKIRCTRCLHTQTIYTNNAYNNNNNNNNQDIVGPFGNVKLPMKCEGNLLSQQINQNPDGGIDPNNPDNQQQNNNDCGINPYVVDPDQSIFIDRQTLKLQESPDMVPTGEIPRSVLLAVERNLVDLAPPGTRLNILCIPTLFTTNNNNNNSSSGGSNDSSVQSVYLRIVGYEQDKTHPNEYANFTQKEEEAIQMLSRRSDIYSILYKSIAPSISGSYTIDIKKSLAVMLMGGSRKKLQDNVKLRGDINILLLGDPSTAKSQFLKFISKVAPIGIYTSGKGSSAAGLTASIVKDSRGEFFLEGGAMVLADGGIVSIDEFDKMRPQDRVAIHEAMEQQTISIAKAGITTVLNSRSSVLAAANPIFGRYDDNKSASDQIDLMTTILSRFDLIFLVRDIREETRDRMICKHVMGVHMTSSTSNANRRGNNTYSRGIGSTSTTNDGNSNNNNNDIFSSITDDIIEASITGGGGDTSSSNNANMSSDEIAESIMRIATSTTNYSSSNETNSDELLLPVPAMKKYVQYCRTKCFPRLSEEAGNVLSSSYVKIRDDVKKQYAGTDNQAAIPITVRQLEALVRISESLAKMRLDNNVQSEDVAEALRLFRVSTMTASTTGTTSSNTNENISSVMNNNNNSNDENAQPNNGINNSNINNRNEINRAESFLRTRLPISGSGSGSAGIVNKRRLIEESCSSMGFNAIIISRVLAIMIKRGEVQEYNKGRLIKRIK